MNTEELELLTDSKYRNYVAAVDKALKNFEYSSEWADLISALGKLNKVLQNNAKYQVVPKKLTIGKRLAQCLHPALPGGVHRKALETYEIIFKIIGPKRLAKDLFLYSSGLFPLLANAAMSVKPTLLSLYEIYYLPLGKTLKPGLQGLLTGILPGLEEGSEYYERTNTLLEKVASAVDQSAFYSALWGSLLTSPAVRLPGITYVLSHLNRKLSMEDQLYIIGSDIELMVEAVSTSVQDTSVLVQRSTLDLILFCFPFHMSQATRPDMIRILSAALHVVLRRDMSLNRRLYAWLLGFDNNGAPIGPRSTRHSNPEEHATYYFNTFSKEMLVQAMVGILQVNGHGEESTLMQDLKPFRILISLLDKPELGPAILEDVLIEVFRTLYTQCKAELELQAEPSFNKDHTQLSSKLRENKKTAELIKTANLLFNSFEPYYMWDYIARWFEECCRRTLHARLQTGPGGGSEQSELPLTNFCLLVDFLLDIVSLPTRSMRVLCQETYIEIQTEHLPQLLLRMISALTSHLHTLHLSELTDSLRLCSKILSKVQPPLLSAGTDGILQLPSGHSSSIKEWENKKVPPISLENPNDVFEDGENPPSSRSSESGFTEFVQYQADTTDDIDRALNEGHGAPGIPIIGSTSSETETGSTVGSEETVVQPPSIMTQGTATRSGKTIQKTAMQCCLEYVQQFLTRFINLYIIQSNSLSQPLGAELPVDTTREQGQTTKWDRESRVDAKVKKTNKKKTPKEYLSAFIAACQLYLECSSFPVYIAEGNRTSELHPGKPEVDCEQVQPPLWLQTLMSACKQASDFSVQGVTISLVMDLVGLTQSVALVTGENLNSVETAQPLSPNQGRVAVVIRPPLTQGNLRYMAEKTDFFKHIALTLWDQLGDGTPQHHQKSVELFYQLHNLVPSSSICEDVISQQLTHRDKKVRMEAHAKFAVLWHLTRDLHINKSSSFGRTFDRSLFIMLDSLNSLDGSTWSVGQAWLNQVLQRHDIARVLEPLLLLLLHPKTQRVSVQRVQAECYWTKSPYHPEEENEKHFMQKFSCADAFSHEPVSQGQLIIPKEGNEKQLAMDEMENFSLTVNPLSDRLSLLSTSSETIPMVVSDFDLPDHQVEILQSSDSGCSQSSTGDNISYEVETESLSAQDSSQTLREDSPDEIVQQVVTDLICKVVSGLGEEAEPVKHSLRSEDTSCKFSPLDNSVEVTKNEDQNIQSSQSSLLSNDSSQLLSASTETGLESLEDEISRNNSSPCIAESQQSLSDLTLASTESKSRKQSHSSIQFSFKGKLPEKMSEKETIVKEAGKQPGAKPKVKIAKRKDEEKKKAQTEKLKQTNVFFSDGLDLENWYSCGEGEISEIESDVGSPGMRKSPSFNIHPLYQHVLLYLQLYDSSRTLYAFSAIKAILKTNPSAFVSAISTTSVNNAYTPQLSLLQNLLARHRISVMGKDFYSHIPVDSNHNFRSSMYIEILISLCLYYMRSHYPTHVKVTSQDLIGNRNMQMMSIEILTLLFAELAKVIESSAKGFPSFISDMLSKCKVQKVILHCLLSSIFSAQKWHSEKIAGKNVVAVEEGFSEDSLINFSEDEFDSGSTLQSQLLKVLQRLIVLEHRVMTVPEENETGFDFVITDLEHIGPQQPMTSLQYLHSQPITCQGMFLCAVIRALHQHCACKMHPQWIGLITSTLPYMGKVLQRVVVSVTLQLCRNLDNLIQQYKYETGLSDNRPLWMASVTPPDMVLTLLEGITTIIHYCLLDPSTQYHQLLVNVDQKHLIEARNGILSILHMIMSSVTLLWSILHLADSSEKTTAAAASITTINLGSTKNLRQQILELLGPISMNHGVHFMAAIAFVWNERRQNKNTSRTKVIPTAGEEQLLLVELVRSISVMRTETVIQTVKEVLKQPPAIAKDKKHLSLEVCMLQFFYAYTQRIPVTSLVDSWAALLLLLKDSIQVGLPAPGQFLILGVLNEFIMKNPTLENKKDQRDLQDVTHKIVDAIGAIAGSSLEQTTWLRRNLEVKPSPKIMVDGNNLESDVEDILSPAMETSNITPSVYSVHALTLLSEVLAHLLDMVFYSDEKERVIPLLVNIMHYVVPYLRNHSAHNASSYRACVQLLSSLSGYQYTRRAWKKEAFDLFMDSSFFQMDASCVNHWRAIMDNLMTHDKTTFRDLMTRVAVAQSSSLNLFANRDAELEQRAMLLKRLAFAIFSSEIDQYQKYLPDIQERLVESLRLPQVPTLHSQVFLFFRVLLLRMSPQHLTSLWPTMITELVQVFLLMEQELTADEDISRTSGPSVAGLETTYTGGNGFSTSYNSQRWLNLYLSACKFLDLALALPSENLPQFQMYRWAFIPEASDDSGLEVRRQGTHQREFKPYVVRLAKLLRKKAKDKQEDFKTVVLEGMEMAKHQKNPEEDSSGKTLSWEPGHLLLTIYTVRSIEQLLPFFNVLSQVFNSKVTSRCVGHSGSPVLYPNCFPNKDIKMENLKTFSSKARQKIEEMVEKDFLEGVIKT
ncbi:protein dopey-1 isoform X1 [Falco biarmicus]|uniref:protein dopey-1 isoform X1 n=3 Tax=Falco rusticolus TaxID=120794 RepID=UPI000FFB6AB7|nr:protein dopey-1 isoform X1 [Falco rusticolus]XP_037247566.1 protein dopey-1 isoform X1 [Falco rusticolus]XP_037247567.1 protein dopey-1 isoform X1 [Falco rusticolus]XP_037247568.1 protein dopey-1 isoform X1 [Falco rusticolus]XP_056199842.1 protein dopey-1 isoform X1 [Falco biarmicus]XP_056199843.1 protein dopey-1 isoform X1 [Falco biarmicus]XP_056199844.1 protein dopey-1 isoform X1 [Falco biarmicus]